MSIRSSRKVIMFITGKYILWGESIPKNILFNFAKKITSRTCLHSVHMCAQCAQNRHIGLVAVLLFSKLNTICLGYFHSNTKKIIKKTINFRGALTGTLAETKALDGCQDFRQTETDTMTGITSIIWTQLPAPLEKKLKYKTMVLPHNSKCGETHLQQEGKGVQCDGGQQEGNVGVEDCSGILQEGS